MFDLTDFQIMELCAQQTVVLVERMGLILPKGSRVYGAHQEAFVRDSRGVEKATFMKVVSPVFGVRIDQAPDKDSVCKVIRVESIDSVVAEVARWLSGSQQPLCVVNATVHVSRHSPGAIQFFGSVDMCWSSAELSPRGETPIATLDLCWTWVCPKCNQRNYHLGAFNAKKHDPAEVEAVMEQLGVENAANLCCLPKQVFCCTCGDAFPAVAPKLQPPPNGGFLPPTEFTP